VTVLSVHVPPVSQVKVNEQFNCSLDTVVLNSRAESGEDTAIDIGSLFICCIYRPSGTT